MDDRDLMPPPPPPLPRPRPPQQHRHHPYQQPQPQPLLPASASRGLPSDLEQFYHEAALIIEMFLLFSEVGTNPFAFQLLTFDAMVYMSVIMDVHGEYNL